MRIGLNLLYAHPGIGGAWNYIEGIVEALARFGSENEYFAYVHDSSRCLVPDLPNFHVRSVRINGARRMMRVLSEHMLLPKLVSRDKLDVLHWFGNVNGLVRCQAACFVSIHDVKAFDLGSIHGFALRDLYMRLLLPYTARTTKTLLPVSQTTALRVKKWFGVAERRMQVIPPPINEKFQPASPDDVSALRVSRKLPSQFWLYVSHYYPHKNHRRLFQAYAGLRRLEPTTWKLVLCGRKNGAETMLNRWMSEAGIEDHVIWLSDLSRSDMPTLFTAATVLIYPSEYEGGGIPVMEAMACGCPVVASRIPAIVESTGGMAVLFEPSQVADITRSMLRAVTEIGLLENLAKGGRERIEAQRPARIAAKLLCAYRSAGVEAELNQ